jgi:acyl-CoA reductase-like NAD-dependent aldehyde dehydrogenase
MDPIAAATSHPWRMLIGGDLVEAAGGEVAETINPSTEEVIAEVPAATARDVAAAVQAGQRAFERWRRTDVRERARRVRAVGDLLLEHEAELGALDAVDGGNPVTAMRNDVRLAVEIINLNADWALELAGRSVPATPDHLHYTVREPYGVVARLVAYNHPLMFVGARIAAPLIAGNAIVIKTPDQAPLSGLRIGELLAEELPKGLVNIISGAGPVAGDALVRHPGVRRIAFIGSVPTGRAIQRAAAESGVKTVTLELGGKNPLIVLDDADPEEAAAGAIKGMNFHWTGGQSCGSTSRLLVHESLADEVLERVCAKAADVRVGDPLDPATEMGAMVSAAQLEKVNRYIRLGRDAGARLVTGGGRPPGLDRGYFVEPTVFAGVTPDMAIAQEEIFGPVLSVMTFRDDDEALRIANGTPYGLTASVWTRDLERAQRMARELEAGYVWINTASAHYPGLPFGGVKDSGVGREEDVGELLSYTQLKAVSIHHGSPA